MVDLSQLSIVMILLMEVSCLTYLEYRAWQTFYTPLCVLMIPYVIVLLITISIAGNYGFVNFNYESIYIWIFGLPLFALPSYMASALLQHYGLSVKTTIENNREKPSSILMVLGAILVVALLFRLYQTISHGFNLFGTEEFTEEFSGKGVWAHLREMIMPLLILSLYYVRKKDYLLWILIALMLVIQFCYMLIHAAVKIKLA